MSQQIPLNKTKWLEEGFILQRPQQDYLLGQGPFSYSDQPGFQTLYHPDFFLSRKKPWLKPSIIWKTNKKKLADFLFEQDPFPKKNQFNLFPKNQTEETSKPQDLKSRLFQNSKYPLDWAGTGWDHFFHNHKNFFNHSKKPSFVLYQEVFFQAQQAIHRGIFQKVVPAFCESFSVRPKLLLLMQNLFKKTDRFSQGFLYGAWNKKSGILGFTPELLFSLKENIFSTMALAGTGFYSGASLFKDKKEMKEHHFVVRSLQEALKDLVKWDKKIMSEMHFPPLKHLRTDLKGQWISRLNFEDICKALHPTAALGGYPKKQAWTWLKNQVSQNKRKYFGAPFGFFEDRTKAFCLVALRALEWDDQKSEIFSGGGLIKESLLQKEWRELALKRNQVKSFFE